MSNQTNGDTKSSRTRMSNGAVRPMYNDDAFNSDLDSPVEEASGKTTPKNYIVCCILLPEGER